MKPIYFLLLLCFSTVCHSQDISLMTYNIRLDHGGDGENQWKNRKDDLSLQILFHEPMIFGVQEALPHQMEDLHAALPLYESVGVGRDDGENKGEYSALFYQKDKIELLESGTFWLSETMNEPSKGWDAAYPRICTWAKVRIRNSETSLLVMNTHLDHVGEKARKESLQLIEQQSNRLNPDQLPVIIMGDLNLEPDSEAIQWFQTKFKDSRVMAGDEAFGPEGTFSGFKTNKALTRRIDYIFYSFNDFKLKKYAVLSDFINMNYLSDHLPVYVLLQSKS